MNSFIKYDFWIVLSIVIIINGCGTGVDTSISGQWQQAGLENISVNTLNPFEENIYATTDSGLHRMKKTTGDWSSLGFTKEDVKDIVFLSNAKWLIAIQNDTSLHLSEHNGESWQPYMNNYGGDNGNRIIQRLEAISKPSDTLFAGAGVLLARSVNAGKNWQPLNEKSGWDAWGGKLYFIKADFYHAGHIWKGGHGPFGWPFLVRSTNNGESWEGIKVVEEGVEATVRDVWVTPEDANTILISIGDIQRSNDGGENWQSVYNKSHINTFTHSARNPEVVYASGENTDGTLFFAASRNFGDSWEMIEMPDSPTELQVNDMVSVMENGNEMLYLGTNKGVYSYRFEE